MSFWCSLLLPLHFWTPILFSYVDHTASMDPEHCVQLNHAIYLEEFLCLHQMPIACSRRIWMTRTPIIWRTTVRTSSNIVSLTEVEEFMDLTAKDEETSIEWCSFCTKGCSQQGEKGWWSCQRDWNPRTVESEWSEGCLLLHWCATAPHWCKDSWPLGGISLGRGRGIPRNSSLPTGTQEFLGKGRGQMPEKFL